MFRRITTSLSITTVVLTVVMLVFMQSCQTEDEGQKVELGGIRDSLPILKSQGVSTLISDSGIIRYKLISEDWFIYDKRNPTFWSFEKGLFIEKFDQAYHVDAFITCDTAYYYDQKGLWELRGRVMVKNLKGETFKTSLLYWDQKTHIIYSDRFMEIKGETQELSGYDFSSNEQMTEYRIHNSKGAFPMADEQNETPHPDPQMMNQYSDTTKTTSL